MEFIKRSVKKALQLIKSNKLETIFLGLILVLAIFLRFYKITELHFFTYDQARDDLIVKRILVDHKLTLLGPQSSMRGVYLPPFYYYTLVPILWLSKLNPVGVDIYTAFVGVLTVVLIWYISRDFFGEMVGLAIGALYATSPLIVELSHRAWNPNTQPFFILLTIFFLYQLFKAKKEIYLIFTSLALGYAINLHYGALALMPIWIFAFIWSFVRLEKKWVFLSGLILFLFGAPLLLFDLRHNFMLTKNIYLYFFAGERVSLSPTKFFEPMVASIYQLFVALLSGSFLKTAQVPFEFWGKLGSVLTFAPVSIIAHKPLLVQYQWWGIGLLILIICSVIWSYFHKAKILILNLLIASILISALFSRFYIGKFYFFYYIFLYPIPFLFLGLMFWFLWQKKWTRSFVIIIFAGMLWFNISNVLVFEEPERTIKDIKQVARVIANDVDISKTFNIAANYKNPDRWDHNAVDYRYFVEAFYKKRALDWQPEDYERAEILYVVAEGGLPDPVNAKIMEIYEFSPKKIEKTWQLPKETFIYKLVK
ncbi:MAG: ArnT family glycosyltransferase [Patescibacteria group bacterium]